jgi:uncharacterized protein (DUF1501 family)
LNLKYSEILDDRINKSLDSEKIQAIQGAYIHETSIKKAIKEFTPDPAKSTLDNNLMLAGHFLANDYSQCISIQAGSPLQWDTHHNNATEQSSNFESLFSALNSLLSSVNSGSLSALSNNLTIVVKSELGRSPQLNSSLKKGKSHWPFTSTMLWGTGINGGKTFGETDNRLRGLPINPIFGEVNGTGAIPLEMKHIFAALYNLFGIPSTLLMPDTTPASMLLSLGE